MTYIEIDTYRRCGSQKTLELNVACSECSTKLKGHENFCPFCGHKLDKLPTSVPEKTILDLLLANRGSLASQEPPVHTVVYTDAPNDRGISISPAEQTSQSDDTEWLGLADQIVPPKAKPQGTPTCPYHKGDPSCCGCCTSKGACTVTVLTSMPPQYNMCPFRGSGYIRCSEAD